MILAIKNIFLKRSNWEYFIYFLLINAVLSYIKLSNELKILLIGLGIFLPLFLAAFGRSQKPSHEQPTPFQEFLHPLSPWVGITLVLVTLWIHLYRLDDSIPLPFGDNSLEAIFSMDLSKKWNDRLFYFSAQHPPVYYWINSLFIRWIPSSFEALRMTSTLSALVSVPLYYCALSGVFSKSFSLLGTGGMILSLWCFAFGRICCLGAAILPWELIGFILLGRYFHSYALSEKRSLLAWMGFVVGLGYLIFPIWPFVLLVFLITVFVFEWSKGHSIRKSLISLFWFALFFLLAFCPLLLAIEHGDYNLLGRLTSAFSGTDPKHVSFPITFSYLSCLFWGPLQDVTVGYTENFERLNPLWGALFFVGMIQLIRNRAHPLSRWILFSSLIFFSPSFFSTYVETFRILTLLPLLLVVISWGASNLLLSLPNSRRVLAIGVFLVFSTAWDGARVIQYLSSPSQTATRNYVQVLKNLSLSRGPAVVLADFLPKGNPDLFVDTFDFNVSQNPRLNQAKANWALLSFNQHYFPYLSKLFPKAHWIFSEVPTIGGDGMLAIIPIDSSNQSLLRSWAVAQDYFHRLNSQIVNINLPRTYQSALRALAEGQTLVQGDRFLESCYWEKAADFYYNHDFKNHYPQVVGSLQQAIDRGFPAAHLYYDLGSLYLRKRNFNGARQAFLSALKTDPKNKPVLQALLLLDKAASKSAVP
jgi:tetratricopeptide (TPR) repeat protein